MVWCGVVWRVGLCDVIRYDVMRCNMVWCHVVWCDMAWVVQLIQVTCPPGKAANEESFISFCSLLSSLVVDPLTFRGKE